MKTAFLQQALPSLVMVPGFATLVPGVARAESDRKVFRKAAGKYEGKFFGVLMVENMQTMRFVAKGRVIVPVGKGKGRVVLSVMGQQSNLPAVVKKALVRQNGKKVIYRGRNGIPGRLTPNAGTLTGPFEATVILRENQDIKTNTTLTNARAMLKGPFKGKK